METKFLLEVEGLTKRGTGKFILKDISFKIGRGECFAITGNVESGKSTLLKCIQQYKYFPGVIDFKKGGAPEVRYISQQHIFSNLSGVNNFYYQQRFNATEAGDARTVIQEMTNSGGDDEAATEALELLRIGYLKDTPLIQLSNGEHKRYQIAEALYGNAEWLLLDDPFTGLDVASRTMLEEVITSLIHKGIHILITTRGAIPSFVTNVLLLNDGMLAGVFTKENFEKTGWSKSKKEPAIFDYPALLKVDVADDFDFAVRMEDVQITYHDKKILSGVDWEIRKGEKWSVSGPNGSGKSTLLSLITGDNPQAFANDIYLFDRKRGTGETIWEIKRRIGYVSPELHHHFDKSFSVHDVVASGIFDTIGLFRKLTNEQARTVKEMLLSFHLDEYANKPLGSLSFGTQRWVLLARAVVKNPPLLVLDEPCQGLDDDLRREFVSFIDKLCADTNRTLIYVTHVDEEIPWCVTHQLILDKGQIKEKINNGKEHHSDSRRRHRA